VLARRLTYLLVIYTLAGGSLIYSVTVTGKPGSLYSVRIWLGAAFALSAIISMGMVAMMWRKNSRSLHYIRRQLHQFAQENRIGLVMIDVQNELADLVGDINRYLTQMGARFADSRLVQKELKIQAGAAEAELKQMETVICSISEAVLVTDRYDDLLLANRAAESLLGFSLDQGYRSPIKEVLADQELADLILGIRRTRRRRDSRILERQIIKDSKILTLKVMLSCVMDSSYEAIGVVAVIHDMTAERELARLKDDFVSNVSHELKTPLASIRACAEMLADQEARSEEARKQMCEIIQEQSGQLNRLIDNILNISRIESGMVSADRREMNLSQVIREAITAVEPQSQTKGLSLGSEIPPELWISADREMIYHAMMNVLSNAVKYTRPGGHVRIRAYSDGPAYAVVEVEDDGVGIPQQSLDKVFNKFYRVPEHRELTGGTGLGLNLVRQIIEAVHDGEVSVQSRYGQGSTFTLRLPTGAGQPALF
jgi:two-component system, OmpR family, phosphate regulon sensor histidine kinase PhoR